MVNLFRQEITYFRMRNVWWVNLAGVGMVIQHNFIDTCLKIASSNLTGFSFIFSSTEVHTSGGS